MTTDTEAGLSGRWGVTPNVTLSGTVNPDFSQVEADVAQLEVNTRFALFFPEKRPFFLEGADFYTTPLQAVFTRTVADPAWGAKLTGKEGKNAFGVFFARDRQTNLLLPSNQGSRLAFLDDDVTSSVFRYRRDVGANSTLGVLYTGRDGSDYSNDVYGLDGFLRFNSSNALRFQYLRSDTSYPGGSGLGDDLTGDGWLLQYDYLTRNWVATIPHTDLAEDFRADYGLHPAGRRQDHRGAAAPPDLGQRRQLVRPAHLRRRPRSTRRTRRATRPTRTSSCSSTTSDRTRRCVEVAVSQGRGALPRHALRHRPAERRSR